MPKKSNCKLSPHLCATQGLLNAQPIQLLPNGDMYETLGIEGLFQSTDMNDDTGQIP